MVSHLVNTFVRTRFASGMLHLMSWCRKTIDLLQVQGLWRKRTWPL